jgi:hypothetical protein
VTGVRYQVGPADFLPSCMCLTQKVPDPRWPSREVTAECTWCLRESGVEGPSDERYTSTLMDLECGVGEDIDLVVVFRVGEGDELGSNKPVPVLLARNDSGRKALIPA